MINGERIINRVLKAMTVSEAYRVLGVPQNADADIVQKKFKELVRKNHPDVGGDTKVMQTINQAKDIVDKVLKQDVTTRQKDDEAKQKYQDWKKQRDKEDQENKKTFEDKADAVINIMKANAHKYIAYFSKITGKDTSMDFKKHVSENSYKLEFNFTAAGIHFSLELTSVHSIHPKASDGFYYDAKFYYDNRIYKMQAKNYVVGDNNTLIDPETLFPATKLKKIVGAPGVEKIQKKFKRADAENMLKRELDATRIDNESWRFPTNNPDEYIIVYRITMLGQATWNINGLYQKFRRLATPVRGHTYVEILEETNVDRVSNFATFIKDMKEAKKGNFNWKYKE
jgi:curved DNA-binding protein CbpA